MLIPAIPLPEKSQRNAALGLQALGSYLKLTCEYELQILSNTKSGAPKDHCARLPWFFIFSVIVYC